MGHCTIHYRNNEIATEEQCLLWNTQTQRHIIYGSKLEYNLKTWIQFILYNLIHIRRLSGNDIKFYKFTANLICQQSEIFEFIFEPVIFQFDANISG